MVEFVIIRTLGPRRDYCQITNGLLHTTKFDLGQEFPHLVRRYKSRAAAKGVITRILKKYPSGQEGCITDFGVEPWTLKTSPSPSVTAST